MANKKSKKPNYRNTVKKSKKKGYYKSKKSGKNTKQEAKTVIKQKSLQSKSGPMPRAVMVGAHCQYIDLCALDSKAATGCNSGQKFVVKVKL